jgi:hypothetical protein
MVSIDVATLRAAAGATFTHNHPQGSGPSCDDVALGIEFALHEVRVVTADCRFFVGGYSHLSCSGVKRHYAAAEIGVHNALRDEIRRGLLNPADYFQESIHRVWLRLSTQLGFLYSGEHS